jgi:hypothetical protein
MTKVIKLTVEVVQGVEDTDIFMSDGGVATLHHNGEHMVTTYYQDRITSERYAEDMWDELAEGKTYCKDWEGEDKTTTEMITDAILWLGGSIDSKTKYIQQQH